MNLIGDLNKTIMKSNLIRMPVDNLKKVYNLMPSLPELEMKRRNYGRLTLIFLGLFLGGCLISFYLYYVILDFEIRRNISLRPKAIVRWIYMNLPFPLTLKIYIFDVLNKEEVQRGEKPILKQIGPYVFHEYVIKTNATDFNSEDALEFTTRKKYIFRPELSHGLTGEEIVTTLHPIINGIGLAVQAEHQQFMHVAIAAIKAMFHDPVDAFWSGRALDLIMDGIEIDCSSKDPLVRIACREIDRNGGATIMRTNETTFKFSMLGGSNNTVSGVYKVLRGKRYPRELGKIIELDGEEKMKVWRGDKCNEIRGTDGLIFPPFQTFDEPVHFFVKQLCLNIDLRYHRRTHLRGIRMHLFEYKIGNIAKETDLECYCRHPNQCPINGTIDLMPCLKVPITGSLPHFLHADPSLLKNVHGLNPSEANHSFTLNMELRTGVPLSGAGRFQLNFELEPVPQIDIMSNLPKMIFPFIWFEEGADVPDALVNLLKYTLIFGTGLNRCLQYFSLTVGPVGFIICFTIFLMFKCNMVRLKDAPRRIYVSEGRDVEVSMVGHGYPTRWMNNLGRDGRPPNSTRSAGY